MVKTFALLVVLLAPTSLFSQTSGEGVLSGKLLDSTTQKPLGLATVAVFSATDTVLITYRMTTPAGNFQVPQLPLNRPLRILISYTGYSVYREEFVLTSEMPKRSLGNIALLHSVRTLDEILVAAERPPVVMKKDTIEFNASAFRTLPAALVEDLLKKLPGVHLEPNGNITVNGRKVNRILVDGKEFFGSDVRIATRNLPANIIDKVQVMSDQEESQVNPERPVAQIGQVVNLTLKKGIKQGWFGKTYGGAGTDRRYETGGIGNWFRDTLQISLLGFFNNINRAGFGFSDLRSLGGFDRSGVSGISTAGGGLSVNGISFGGSSEGLQTSGGAGANLNTVLHKKITLNTQYFYGSFRNKLTEQTNRQQFLADTVFSGENRRLENANLDNHRLGFVLAVRPNALTRFDFRPSVVLSSQQTQRTLLTRMQSNKAGLLNQSANDGRQEIGDLSYAHTMSYIRNFAKKGRSLIVHQLMNINEARNNQQNTVSYQVTALPATALDQLRKRELGNASLNTTLTYTEPLSMKAKLRVAYGMQYMHNKDELLTFNPQDPGGGYTLLNEPLSNGIRRTLLRNNLTASLAWNVKSITVTPSLAFFQLNTNTRFWKNPFLRQRFTYWLPGISVDWKELNVSYSVTPNAPSVLDLQPVPDNTNPLFVHQGNPGLIPSLAHNLYVNYYRYVPQQLLSINVYLNGNITHSGIIRSRTVDATGVQTSRPLNADDLHTFFSQVNVNKQFRLQKNVLLTAATGYFANYFRTYLIVNGQRGFLQTLDLSPYLRTGLNWKDRVEWNIGYARGIYHTYSGQADLPDLRADRFSFTTDVVLRWPNRFVWESSLDHRGNPGAGPGIRQTTALWNGAVTYLFLKENKGQLKLSVFDLLDQNASVSRISFENYVQERQASVLQRFLLLTFTYNIRNFSAGKVGGKQSLFNF